MNWLGDLPNAGYSTYREQALSDAMMLYLRSFERMADGRQLLLMMVIEGKEQWLQIARREFRGHRISEDELTGIWDYMVKMAGVNPVDQLANLLKIRPGRAWTDEEKSHIARYGFAPKAPHA